mmetsp:Transcript_29191/g.61441  ORF Transcript_29191/g.61441 Transcript_29191/m.61441 type:complete len:85 (-) Transcript_29191:70-324(-)
MVQRNKTPEMTCIIMSWGSGGRWCHFALCFIQFLSVLNSAHSSSSVVYGTYYTYLLSIIEIFCHKNEKRRYFYKQTGKITKKYV